MSAKGFRDDLAQKVVREVLAMLWRGINNPLRVRILEVVNEEPMSPVRFQREYGGAPLAKTSYHFKELAKYGYIKCVEEIPRRGSVEHVYEAIERASFDDKAWSKVPPRERIPISATVLQGFIARAAGALTAGTFDSRDNRHLTWTGMRSHEKGWNRAVEILARAHEELEANRVETEAELDEAGEEGFRITYGAACFESPPPGKGKASRSRGR